MELDTLESNETSPVETSEENLPLKKWLVPFFVIPSVIVVTLAGIFLLFGMLTSSDRTPRENLDRVRHGGRGDRKQAAFELQRQIQNQSQEHSVFDAKFVPDLIEALEHSRKEDEDLFIRCWLISTLGYIGDVRAIPVLKLSLEDTGEIIESGVTWSVRFLAAQALATIGTPEAIEPLFELLKTSPDKGLRILAAGGIGRVDFPKNREVLKAALLDQEPEVRWTAALGLARFGEEVAAKTLHEVLDPQNAKVWKTEQARVDSIRLAIDALVLLKDREALPLLKQLDVPEEKDRKIRDFAKKGIQKLEQPN